MRGRKVGFGALALAAALAAAAVPLAAQTPVAAGPPAAAAAAPSFPAAPGSDLAEGERLFRENRPADAVPYLQRALLAPGVDERAWLWLAVAQQQLGKPDEAVAVLRKGLAQARTLKPLFLFNLGNAFLLQGKASFAEESFAEAIAADQALAPAYLNRANARISLRNWAGASADYGRYLELEPSSPQRPAIEEIVRRIAAVVQAERAKAADEAARLLAEEEARKLLLEQVAASLKAAAEETTSLSAGSGAVQGYGDELNLDE